jgi:hemerythrin-like domain-containing protein
MYVVHTMFLREFGLMAALVRGVTAGDTERAQIVAEHIELMNGILHHHHVGEDKHLWPRLLERGSGEAASVVHLMKDQHDSIGKTIDEIDGALGAWRSGAASGSGEALANSFDRLAQLLEEHTREEEERALPIIEKCITTTEWGTMVQEAAAGIPQESLALVFGMMMYEGDPEVMELILSYMPPEMRPGMKDLSRQAFVSHSERVHGTATPPRSRTERPFSSRERVPRERRVS